MSKTAKMVLAIVGVAMVFAVSVCVLIFSILNKQKNAEYYELGTDRIASVKAVVGPRNISGVSVNIVNGVSTKLYEYQSENSTKDIEEYVTYLTETEGFSIVDLNSDSNRPVYTKKSNDEGKVLIVTINNTGFGFSLKIQKGKGDIE